MVHGPSGLWTTATINFVKALGADPKRSIPFKIAYVPEGKLRKHPVPTRWRQIDSLIPENLLLEEPPHLHLEPLLLPQVMVQKLPDLIYGLEREGAMKEVNIFPRMFPIWAPWKSGK